MRTGFRDALLLSNRIWLNSADVLDLVLVHEFSLIPRFGEMLLSTSLQYGRLPVAVLTNEGEMSQATHNHSSRDALRMCASADELIPASTSSSMTNSMDNNGNSGAPVIQGT